MLLRAIFLLCCLLWTSAAESAVVFDAKGTAACDISSGGPLSCSTLTVGSGSNRALAVLVSFQSNATAFTVTWNGTTVPLVGTINYNGSANFGTALFCLANPASGAQVLSVTGTGAGELHAVGVSFTGVNQSTPCQNYNSGSQLFVTTSTLAITSATGDIPVVAWSLNTVPTATNGTNVVLDSVGPIVDFAANYGVGAASVSMTATGTGTSTIFISSGADLLASTGAAAILPQLMMTGIGP